MNFPYSLQELADQVPKDGSAPVCPYTKTRDVESWSRKWANVRYVPWGNKHSYVVLQGNERPKRLVPTEYAQEFMKKLWPSYGYPGAEKFYYSLRTAWVGISQKDVKDFMSQNEVAQKFKPVASEKIVLVPTAKSPLEQVQVDVTQLNSDAVGGGHVWIVCLIDVYSRYVAAKLFRKPIGAEEVVQVLESLREAGSKVGVFMKRLQCDNGSENKGETTAWCERNGVRQIFNSPYHSTSNGMVERFHRTLKIMIAKAKMSGVDWSKPAEFSKLVACYNNTWHSGISQIPAVVFSQSSKVIEDSRHALARQDRQKALVQAVRVDRGDTVIVARRAVDTEFRKDNKTKVPATEQNWTNQQYEVVAVPKRTSGRVSVREVGESKNPVIRVRRSEVQRFSLQNRRLKKKSQLNPKK